MAGFIRRQSISNLTDAILGARPDKNTSLIRSRRASSGFSSFSALLAPSMQGRRLSVSPASSLSSFVPICQRAIFPSQPRAAYLPSALRSGNLPCALLGIEPNALTGWRVTHRAGNWLCSSSHLLLTCEIRHHVDTGRVFHAFCEPDNKCGIGRLLQ